MRQASIVPWKDTLRGAAVSLLLMAGPDCLDPLAWSGGSFLCEAIWVNCGPSSKTGGVETITRRSGAEDCFSLLTSVLLTSLLLTCLLRSLAGTGV
jgi:hypothetical protein